MDNSTHDDKLIYFGSAARTDSTQPDAAELADWLREQLESALNRLVRSVNTLVYTRNPVAMAVTAQQCDRVAQLLDELQSLHLQQQACVSRDHRLAMEALLFTEAEGLLAEARRLVAVPLKPVHRGDNVVVLKPDYADLADAAFERMLASSDIPQLLCNDAPDGEQGDWDEQLDFAPADAAEPCRPTLKLVHSSDTVRKP